MDQTVTNVSKSEIARPPQVLAPLIKEDMTHLKDATDRAGMPYCIEIGRKLHEASRTMLWPDLLDWAHHSCGIKQSMLSMYLGLGRHPTPEQFTSMRDFRHREGGEKRKPDKYKSVKKTVNQVDLTALRQGELDRQKERALQRGLGVQLIDIGYKALATKLHPDKGGSQHAMARLNSVRERLKKHA
jgi:hypothetical protein